MRLSCQATKKELLPYTEIESITVIAYSPFATGNLLPYSSGGRKTLEHLAKKYNKTFAQICLNWLIFKKPVITIPKAIDINHLKENADAAGWRMKPKDYEAVDKAFPR